MDLHPIGIAGHHAEATCSGDDLLQIGRVEARLLDRAAQLLEVLRSPSGKLLDLGIHGEQSIEIRAVRNAPSLKLRPAPCRGGVVAALKRKRARVPIVGAGQDRQHETCVGHVPRHRTVDMLDKRVPPVIGGIDGNPSRHRTNPCDPAIRRRDPDRAAEIRAETDRRHVGGDRGAGPSARAPRRDVQIDRIARQPKDFVGGVDVMCKLRSVRLPDQHGTRGPQPLDRDDVLVRDEMLVDLRPKRRPKALRVQDVLNDERDALEGGADPRRSPNVGRTHPPPTTRSGSRCRSH